MMPVSGRQEEGDNHQWALEQADKILCELGFKAESPVPVLTSAQVIGHLRHLLMFTRDPEWRDGQFDEQRMPDGTTIYTAALRYPRSAEYEVWVVQVNEFGVFKFAAPIEREG